MEWRALRRCLRTSPPGWVKGRLCERAEMAACDERAYSVLLAPWLVPVLGSLPLLSTAPARQIQRARIYALVAALCAEGVAPELDLLPMPESPDVSALAHTLLAAWRRGASRAECGFGDEVAYTVAVRSWLHACDRADRWQRAIQLLAHLQRLREAA